MSEPDPRHTPSDIDIVRADAVTITFDDGEVCRFPVTALRTACPCATCRGWRERGQEAWPRPGQSDEIEIVNAELSGAWGLSIDWSDGHSTGIYAWATLRRWWDAGMAAGLVDDPRR
jgi:DUF971 family protein